MALPAQRVEMDDRVKEMLSIATQRGIPVMEVTRPELDRLTEDAVHQGIALQVPPYEYRAADDLLDEAMRRWKRDREAERAPLFVALDGITDPRNLGAIMRSVSDRFGLTVMAISLDGGPTRAFPNYTVDTGQYKAMGMRGQQVPALVLFDTVTKQPMPIGYGVMAADEVMNRIFTLTSVKPGSDF